MMKNIIKSLLKPEAYPETTNKVELLQTHVSWIFLTDRYAYKIKKPVDFGFLNFSTIDRRRFYCNEEIKYNRRLCPDIYEGVVELIQTSEGVAFYGKGTIIDYAVKMKRLPADKMMDKLIDNNAVSIKELHKVTKTIADFHHSTPSSATVASFGSLDKIMFNWIENIEQVVIFEDKTISLSDREFIRSWVNRFAQLNSETFALRVNNGFIRECDGDLHLENICLVDNKVYIFDCIEFNERFRNCDTAADLAFLLMDLDYHGRQDLSEEVLFTYIKLTGDNSMVEVISFYKVYRAFVRGKVESFRLLEKDLEQKEQTSIRQKAIRYFRLARGYIEKLALNPTLFITCGLMGSGKSTLADQLAFELGIRCYNSDKTRKTLAGIELESPVNASFHEGLYSLKNTDATYKELSRLAENELKQKRSVIIDASFSKRNYRLSFAALAKKHSFSLVIIQVSCSENDNKRRLNDRFLSGKSVSDGRPELLEFQRHEFEPPSEDEGKLINLVTSDPPHTLTNYIYNKLQ